MNAHAQDLQPNLADISAHLHALFDPSFVHKYPDAYIQIAYGHPAGGNAINDAQIWHAHDLQDAAKFVALRNAAGYNVYTSPALLRFDRDPPMRRAKEDRYLTSAFAWVEFDRAGDAERVDAILKEKQITPAFTVTTGKHPNLRMHVYFNVADIRDAEHQTQINKALQNLLGTDAVSDACHLMRVAGSINYPPPKKAARGYIAEVTSFRKVSGAPTYRAAHLIALTPAEESDPFTEYAKEFGPQGKSDDDLIALLNATRIKGQWHNNMRDAIASMVGKGWPELAIKAMCAPFADGGIDDKDVQKLIDSAVRKFGREETEETEQPFQDSEAKAPLILTLDQWQGRDLPSPDFLLGEVFHTTCRAIVSAPTGLGKTNFALGTGMRMAAGMNFLHWEGRRACKVLYIDGEMSRRLLKQRLEAEHARLYIGVSEQARDKFKPNGFHALNTEDINNFQPLNTRPGQAAIEQVITDIGGCDFVIFDNIMSLIAGSMADEEAWAKTLPWVKSLTKRGIGQVWVHHTGHDESRGFGTKTREWQMDTVIHLTRVERADTDVSFELEFRKARERRPDNRDDFANANVFLLDDQWHCDAATKATNLKVSPMATKFYEALLNVAGSAETPKSKRLHGCHAVHTDDWKAECEHLGLLDPQGAANSQRAKFYKYRAELIAANKVACEGNHTWIR